VGHVAAAPLAREAAALLALRNEAVLSHRSAAKLWGLLPYSASAPVCVTVPPALSATRPGITIHRASLDRRDVRRREGMALTSPPRTILDLAAELASSSPRADRLSDLEQLVAEAHYRRLASEAELRDQIVRNPRKRGVRALKSVLAIPGGPQRTRSERERRLLRLLRSQRIDGFEVNGRVEGYEVDFLWRTRRVAVESTATTATRAASPSSATD
jgi:hypothetical protein